MKKQIFVFFCILLSISITSKAQLVDSLSRSINQGKLGFDFKFGGGNAIINQSKASTFGVRIGASFGNSFSAGAGVMGFGLFGLGQGFVIPNFKNTQENFVTVQRLQLTYFCMYSEYYFYRNKKWEFSIIPQIGYGTINYQYQVSEINGTSPSVFSKSPKSAIWLYEPTMTGEYKIFKWFGIGADLGFRFAFKNKAVVKERLTSPIYSFHADIYWVSLAKHLFPKHHLIKKL